ncbi:MAG: MarR family winged helix-turn-helix transcriptional regulator [Ktedonobacterales bacterium]
MLCYICIMQQIPPATIEAMAPDTQASAGQLIEVVPLIMREIRRLMRQRGTEELSVPHFRALGYVQRHPGCSLSAVAEHLGLSVAAASRLVDTLVADGFLERRPSPIDRRYIQLHLSTRGAQIRAEAHAHTLQGIAARLEGLSEDERQQIVLALEPLRAIFASPSPFPAATGEASLTSTFPSTADAPNHAHEAVQEGGPQDS